MTTDHAARMLQVPTDARGHSQGPEGVEVAIVLYGDYSSPTCERAYSFVLRARERMGLHLRFTCRHFVVRPNRPTALHAAEAAEAAGAQGRFWEMHNMLFAHQGALDAGHLVEYADALGLDTTRFLRDMAGHTYAECVSAQCSGGASLGVATAPALFVNGVPYDGEWSDEGLKDAIGRAQRPGD